MNVQLRAVTMEDAEQILEWRNDAATRANSFQKELIDMESHVNWLAGKLQDENCHMYIMVDRDMPVGQIRIDEVNHIGEISYMIAPSMRGKGYGKKILKLAEQSPAEGLQVLMGMVEDANESSKKCFRSNGYAEFVGKDCVCFIKTI